MELWVLISCSKLLYKNLMRLRSEPSHSGRDGRENCFFLCCKYSVVVVFEPAGSWRSNFLVLINGAVDASFTSFSKHYFFIFLIVCRRYVSCCGWCGYFDRPWNLGVAPGLLVGVVVDVIIVIIEAIVIVLGVVVLSLSSPFQLLVLLALQLQ